MTMPRSNGMYEKVPSFSSSKAPSNRRFCSAADIVVKSGMTCAPRCWPGARIEEKARVEADLNELRARARADDIASEAARRAGAVQVKEGGE